MRIKLDENLPVRLSAILANLDHDVHTVAEENLSGRSDRDVWEAAQRDARFLITWTSPTFDDLLQEPTAAFCSFDFVPRTVRALSGASKKYSNTRTSVAGVGVS